MQPTTPTSATPSVTSEDNNAQPRAPRSLFRKKATKPLTNGITINRTGIIYLHLMRQSSR